MKPRDPRSIMPIRNDAAYITATEMMADLIINNPGMLEWEDVAESHHTKGTFFFWKGELVRATIDIEPGDTISRGVNVEDTSLDEIVQELDGRINLLEEDVAILNREVFEEGGRIDRLETELHNDVTRIDNDISSLNTTLTTKINTVNTNLTNQISTVNTNLSSQISSVNTSLSNQISNVNTTLGGRITTLDTKVDNNVSRIDGNINTINNVSLPSKVDKVSGYGLSQNNFSDALLNKLNNIAEDANNVQFLVKSFTFIVDDSVNIHYVDIGVDGYIPIALGGFILIPVEGQTSSAKYFTSGALVGYLGYGSDLNTLRVCNQNQNSTGSSGVECHVQTSILYCKGAVVERTSNQ